MKNDLPETWISQYTDALYRWAFHKTSSVEIAEDLVQDTFLAAAEKINNFKGDSSPKTWLFSILNHKIIDYYRKKVRQPLSLGSNSNQTFFHEDGGWQQARKPKEWHEEDSNLLDDAEFRQILEKCLDALPDKWNATVRMKYLTEQSSDTICQELEISPTNLWQIMHRAKLQLR
ncbi:MAG: sigma-70 family RNA polymerase sigma factor, partial [Bacteroidales bacterium]|nr:sigma-70 family RNA polymerase sigma factor [Bacteroidales bacterium]